MGKGKAVWQSRTIWVNGLTLLAGVLSLLSGSHLVATNPALVSAFVTGAAVVNVALRFVTDQPIVSD